jgi:hypothetical protein
MPLNANNRGRPRPIGSDAPELEPDRVGDHGGSEDDEVQVLHPAAGSCHQRHDRLRHEAVPRPEQPLDDGHHREDDGTDDACGGQGGDQQARLPGLGGRLPRLSPDRQPLLSAVAGGPSTVLSYVVLHAHGCLLIVVGDLAPLCLIVGRA